jgi:hypothetical protein
MMSNEVEQPDWTSLMYGFAREQRDRAQQLYERCYDILSKEADRKEAEYVGPRDKAFAKLRLRASFELSDKQWVQVHSSAPLTDEDKANLANKLKVQVGE